MITEEEANASAEHWDKLLKSTLKAKNRAYAERNNCVAVMARMALDLGYSAGLGLHEDETECEPGWRFIVFIDLPTGQVSWHIHDSELPKFSFLEKYTNKWDRHDTKEKYRRCSAFAKR